MMKNMENELDEDSDEMASEGNEVYKCKEVIHDNLISTGQLDLLKRFIQNRLAQSGWTQALKMECIDYIKKRGVENVNVSHMVEDIHTVGREKFPEDIRKELFAFLLDFAKTYVEVDESAPPLSEADAAYSGQGFPFRYQSRDAIPDPGLGVGVSTSANDSSSNSSCSSQSASDEDENESSRRSRRLFGKKTTRLPRLHPENLKLTERDESESEEDEEDAEGEVEEEDGSENEEEGFDNEGYEVESEGSDGTEEEKDKMKLRGSRGRAVQEVEEEESSSKSANENEEEEEELMDI